MNRHYFISNDLDDLERIEQELESRGVNRPQIHILSKDDTAVARHHHLHNIEAAFKQDVANGMLLGAMFGALFATLVMTAGYMSNLAETYTWIPFYFLALVLFSVLTWSGGLYGIQAPHQDFWQFQNVLNHGKHVFIVDLSPSQEKILQQIKAKHPQLNDTGTAKATPRWMIMGQQYFRNIASSTFP